jgi:hypothetical protein
MIEVSMRCPCGTHAVVDTTPGRAAERYRCGCPRCYDPTPGGNSSRSFCEGFGATPEEAIADWWESVERVWDISYEPNTLIAELSEQAGDEADRQSGWLIEQGRTCWEQSVAGGRTCWYGPREVAL